MTLEQLGNDLLRGLAAGSIYALIGIGFNVTFATTNVLNFAHGEFFMLGAMVGLLLMSAGLPMFAALALAILVAGALGALEERFAVRPASRFGHSAFGWFLSTLGVSIVLRSGASLVMGPNARNFPDIFSQSPMHAVGLLIVPQQLGLIALALVVTGLLLVFYDRTLLGQALSAIAQDRDAAALRGIPVGRFAMIAFGISTGIAALTGFFTAPITLFYPAMGVIYLFKGFIAAAVGGMPDVRGALLGGLLLGLIEIFGVEWIGPGYRDLVTFLALLAVLAIRPSGLFGRESVRAV